LYTYQFMLMNMVAKGFVILAYDPPSQGERGMYGNFGMFYIYMFDEFVPRTQRL